MKYVVLVFLCFCALSSPSKGDSGKCLVLGSLKHEQYQDLSQKISQLLTKGGVCHRIRYAPEKRLTSLLHRREIDGELIRVPDYNMMVGEIAFPVEPPIARGYGLLIVADPQFKTVETLKEEAVGIIRGQQWATKSVEFVSNVYEVTDFKQLPEMLEARRISGFLIDSVSWQMVTRSYPQFHAHFIKDLSAHIWLLNEHRDKAKQISEILKNLDEGPFTQ